MRHLIFLSILIFPFFSFAKFQQSDFEGTYTTYSSSAGGITEPDFQNTSATVIALLTVDKCGNGQIDFLSESIYSPPHELTSTILYNLPAKLALTDSKLGIGTLTVVGNPGPGLVTEFDVIISKSKPNGRVAEIVFNLSKITSIDGSTPIVHNTRLGIGKRR